MAIHRNVLRYGSPDPLPERIPLRAGPIFCAFVEGDLRDIALGGQVILRRIYVAVRDAHWGTVPVCLSGLEILRRERSFAVRFRAEHHAGEIHFFWLGTFLGEADGTLTLAMEGEALGAFWVNRVGFCALYADTCAGLPCTVEHTDGAMEEGRFPEGISPHQPFFALHAISHEALPGVRLRVSFEGDTFEMEDQRNWSDASFKIYSRPLALPYPYRLERGERVSQTVRIEVLGTLPQAKVEEGGPTLLEISPQSAGPLPDWGVSIAGDAPAGRMRERLRALGPAHLRAECDLTSEGWAWDLERTKAWAHALGASLEIALWVPSPWEGALQELARVAAGSALPVRRWLLYGCGASATPEGLASFARRMLGPLASEAEFAIGTPLHFTELNRARPPAEGAEAVCWSLTPQVHTFDNASLMETLATQGLITRNVRALYPRARLTISPITLKPRDAADRTDRRQFSLFAAAWAAASIKYLAEAGVASLTYFEALGPRGILEEERISLAYYVFAWLARWRGAEVYAVFSSAPLRSVALALGRGTKTAALLANLTNSPQEVLLRPVTQKVRLVRLNEMNAEAAMDDPEGEWPLEAVCAPNREGALPLLLWPYEVVWVNDPF